MVNRISMKVALIIAILALLGIGLSCDSSSPSQAPDFTLSTLTGGNITLSELQGTLVVLNFWSISCSYCRQQLPYLENVAQQAEGQIEVIAVNMVDSNASVQSFFGDYEPTMIVALDENAEVFVNYCQNFDNSRGYVPFTLFIDSEGMVQYRKIGAFASEEALWDTLHDVFGVTIP
ncbi:MAG TPA: TlpA disulfide reductase family protein [Dehalococcoidia bacterium]|nr:TlpA disulfide reductase family protein [Dehalococcoidia bacterium]